MTPDPVAWSPTTQLQDIVQAARRPARQPGVIGSAAGRACDVDEVTVDSAVRDDRERIAADLHDTVIQRLFTTGLALQGLLKIVAAPEAARRVEAAIADVDETIRDIRSAIFALDVPVVARRGVRSEVLTLIAGSAASLGFEPRLRFCGPIDATITPDISVHLVAVLREALANVARHARATKVEVTVTVADGRVTARVDDNGIGPGAYARPGGRGVTNLAHRAQSLGGSMNLTVGVDGAGTGLTWQVPLDPS